MIKCRLERFWSLRSFIFNLNKKSYLDKNIRYTTYRHEIEVPQTIFSPWIDDNQEIVAIDNKVSYVGITVSQCLYEDNIAQFALRCGT